MSHVVQDWGGIRFTFISNLSFLQFWESSIHQKHHYTRQIMRNMSNNCPLLVIRASKLLILLSCRGIIVRHSVFLLKKKSQSGTRPPDLYAFLHHLFKPASHLLLGFTCSTKTSSLRQISLGKYSPKTVLGSDLITRSQRPARAMRHEDTNNEFLPSSPAIFAAILCKRVGKMWCINR